MAQWLEHLALEPVKAGLLPGGVFLIILVVKLVML